MRVRFHYQVMISRYFAVQRTRQPSQREVAFFGRHYLVYSEGSHYPVEIEKSHPAHLDRGQILATTPMLVSAQGEVKCGVRVSRL